MAADDDDDDDDGRLLVESLAWHVPLASPRTGVFYGRHVTDLPVKIADIPTQCVATRGEHHAADGGGTEDEFLSSVGGDDDGRTCNDLFLFNILIL